VFKHIQEQDTRLSNNWDWDSEYGYYWL